MPDLNTLNDFQLLELGAWAISFVLGLYMLLDMLKTNITYTEDVLLSSREGEIEDAFVVDPTHQGGHK